MSGSLHNTLLAWVDHRLEEMLLAPPMWGSREAVELQVLLLLELKALVRHPSFMADEPRRVIDSYLQYLHARFPRLPSQPLHELTAAGPDSEFTDVLRDFRAQLDAAILDENPFEHSELAIALTFSPDRAPSATTFTGYYEEFRRATRAIVRAGEQGRPTKPIEQATDFSLEDVRVAPKNGRPASALLMLGTAAGQQDFEARERVRQGLASFVTMAEWASSGEGVSALAVDDVEARTRTAVQALRIIPRRGIKTVSIGGRLIGRSKPVELRPEQESRFVQVVGAGSTPEAFDESDEVRAIDLDRGVLRLGKKPSSITCYVRPDQLESVARVGAQARVQGIRYRPLAGRPFVLVDSLEVQAASDE